MHRIARVPVAVILGLGLAATASGDDVVVELGAGDGFSVEDASSTERWRVDSGGVHATGEVRVGGEVVIDPDASGETSATKQPSLWVVKPDSNAAALILESGGSNTGQLVCIGNVDSSDGFSGDVCGLMIGKVGHMRSPLSWGLLGQEYWSLNSEGVIEQTLVPTGMPGDFMLAVGADVPGPAIYTSSSAAPNSTLQWFAAHQAVGRPVVAVIDDDSSGDSGDQGFSLWMCDAQSDLSDDAGGDRWDFTAATNNLDLEGAGTPFSGVVAGDRLAIINAATRPEGSGDANFHEVMAVHGGGTDVTLSNVVNDSDDSRLSIFKCNERIYRHPDGGIVIDANRIASDPCDTHPEGYMFYNDTLDYYCFCNGAGDDVQMHDPTAACF